MKGLIKDSIGSWYNILRNMVIPHYSETVVYTTGAFIPSDNILKKGSRCIYTSDGGAVKFDWIMSDGATQTSTRAGTVIHAPNVIKVYEAGTLAAAAEVAR